MSDDLTVPPARELPPGRRREGRALLVGELRRQGPERRRRPRLARGPIVGMVVLLVVSAGAYAAWTWWNQPVLTEGSANYRWNFDDVRDMVATSELVVLGEVVGAERGARLDQTDVVFTTRHLQLRVERTWFGKPAGGVVVVEDLGWAKARGREVPWRVRGTIRLEVGDRAVLFLGKERGSGRFWLLNDQAAYRVEGTDIAGSNRTDPLVRRVEELSVPELEQVVGEATAAVRAGTLEPLPEGGRRP